MKGQKKNGSKDIRATKQHSSSNAKQNLFKLSNSHGITLVALVVSIVVMLVLAGVSINAVVGDNGIITQAQSATYATSRAVLEEWLNQLYVENYDDFSEYDNKMEAFLSSSYASYFYNPSTDGDGDGTTYGAVSYVVDSEGHALYLIKKSALPDDIKSQLAGGDAGEGKYADYLALTDVYGVTSELKVYYCSAGTSTILGVTEDELDTDDIERTVTISDNGLKGLLSSYADTDGTIKASSLRKVKTLTVDSSVSSLSDLYNLTSLQELTIEGATLSNLNGIQNCSQLYKVYFKSSTVGDYSAMAKLSSKLSHLYFYDIDNNELSTACTGLASAEFSGLRYFGVFGGTYGVEYFTKPSTVSSSKATNSKNLTTLEPLSNLSSTTKSAVRYLAINNNNLAGDLSYISGFTNLVSLRCEYNNLTSLNGLNCASTLVYICGCNNQLGATVGTDSEGNSTTVAEDTTTGTTISVLADNTKLYYVYLVNNSYLANVSYFSNDLAIEYLYLAGCSTSMIVNGITTIIGNCGANYSLPVKLLTGSVYNVSDYYTISASSTITADSDLYDNIKTDLINGSQYITHLNFNNVVFENDDMYQNILEYMIELKYVTFSGCTGLQSINFVHEQTSTSNGTTGVTKLIELNLVNTGTSLTDLTPLNNYATSLKTLNISNEGIDLTTIQTTISRLTSNTPYYSNSSYGLSCNKSSLYQQLSNCTELTSFIGDCQVSNSEATCLGTIDMSNCANLTKIYTTHWPYQVILPTCISSFYADQGYGPIFSSGTRCCNERSCRNRFVC